MWILWLNRSYFAEACLHSSEDFRRITHYNDEKTIVGAISRKTTKKNKGKKESSQFRWVSSVDVRGEGL